MKRTTIGICLFLALALLIMGCSKEEIPSPEDTPLPSVEPEPVTCADLAGAQRDKCCVNELDDLDAYFDELDGGCSVILKPDLNEDLAPPEIPVVEEFCGTSTEMPCESDRDCVTMGCSGQVCGHLKELSDIATTCDYRLCYNPDLYGLGCGCINNVCQWG